MLNRKLSLFSAFFNSIKLPEIEAWQSLKETSLILRLAIDVFVFTKDAPPEYALKLLKK